MKSKTFYSLITLTGAGLTVTAQVGINTVNPQGVFNIDAAKDNPVTGTPSTAQQSDDISVSAAGNLGVGTTVPSNKVHINGTDPLRLQGLTSGSTTTDQLLVTDPSGVVKNIGTLGALSIPNPAIFRLEAVQDDFLSTQSAGESQVVPMSVIKNTISGLTYNTANSTITFPAGTYQMTIVYEATHNSTGCTISSYFVDFPINSMTTRVHSTSSHTEGGVAIHGGTITYATTLPAGRTWPISLGRGQSGNCTGAGMTLNATSTQLLVFRIGD
ncbi:hypothetical protein ODZ84_11150 [Chryseobacterium fluminis]|uniref:hypothetical protein n=1 Tax=Chryseobacterium fluminis TaxID=2983606 RepID=UPI00225AF534|nr:hypothetical protein [Chryseobacterium sp. MMS21-Ot14]UZU00082.1 hypothetical protein ODZ84_11150 [Chryseobacterium sp. MMS21-Ot14]